MWKNFQIALPDDEELGLLLKPGGKKHKVKNTLVVKQARPA